MRPSIGRPGPRCCRHSRPLRLARRAVPSSRPPSTSTRRYATSCTRSARAGASTSPRPSCWRRPTSRACAAVTRSAPPRSPSRLSRPVCTATRWRRPAPSASRPFAARHPGRALPARGVRRQDGAVLAAGPRALSAGHPFGGSRKRSCWLYASAVSIASPSRLEQPEGQRRFTRGDSCRPAGDGHAVQWQRP